MNRTKLVQLAIKGLEAEKAQIESEISDLKAQLMPVVRRGRKGWSAAKRKEHSQRMKRVWAEKRRKAS